MSGFGERLRPTIRMRLTVLYTGLFLGAGIVLLGLTYLLVQNNLQRQAEPRVNQVFQGQIPAGAESAVAPAGPSRVDVQKVLIAGREDYQRETLSALLTQGGIALGLVGAAGLGLGWLVADRALRPVHAITDTARRVARSHDLTERIAYAGPRDDVKELADTFDTMLGRRRGRSTGSGGSWRTPRTSCAPRSPSTGRSWTWRCAARTPPTTSSGSASRCWW